MSGIFYAGGVLVGSTAFAGYQNMLGVRWTETVQTQDIDIARDREIEVAIPRPKAAAEKIETLLAKWSPVFNTAFPTAPPVIYKVPNSEFRVDFLSPLRGRGDTATVEKQKGFPPTQKLRYLDIILKDPIPSAIPTSRGAIFTYLPQPERFLIHKLMVSTLRSDGIKARKDVRQAEALLSVFVDYDLENVRQIAKEVVNRGPNWKKRLHDGAKKVRDKSLSEALKV